MIGEAMMLARQLLAALLELRQALEEHTSELRRIRGEES